MYELTDEHRAAFGPHHDKWMKIALSTEAMGKSEKDRYRRAARGLYAAADLPEPNVVFAPSPLRAAVVAGLAVAAEAHLEAGKKLLPRKHGELGVTTLARMALGDTPRAAAFGTPLHRDNKWHPSLRPEVDRAADELGVEREDARSACSSAYLMRDSGNQWAGWSEFLSFFRHVAKLPLDYSKWRHYETLAEAGPRYMGSKWCVISERPEVLSQDRDARPHHDSGPFARWRDGVELYAIHGTYVPKSIVTNPELIELKDINGTSDAEIRRIMIERYGFERYVRDAGMSVVDESKDPLGLPRKLYMDGSGTLIVQLYNSTEDADGTRRVYYVPCHPELCPLLPDGTLGGRQARTALNAVASTFGMTGEEYVLAVET